MDFIPQGELEFSVFAATFVGAAVNRAALLGIPQAAVSSLQTKLAAYTTAQTAAEQPNAGKLDRDNRGAKRDALTAEIRHVKNAWIDGNPSGEATNEIRQEFGLPPRDDTRTKTGVPSEVVEFTLRHGDFLQVIVVHGARPANYNGALALYQVGGPEPAPEDLRESRLLTKPHETLTFTSAQKGQTLWIALCWQNDEGDRGPLSPVQSIVIG
ncbi:MAG: hypothetical protein MdMp014T_0429 [Treponematales bacterium]